MSKRDILWEKNFFEMEVVKLPEVHMEKFVEFEKILSIIVDDVGVTLVGRIMRNGHICCHGF